MFCVGGISKIEIYDDEEGFKMTFDQFHAKEQGYCNCCYN